MSKPKSIALSYCEVFSDGTVRTNWGADADDFDLENFGVGNEINGRYLIRSELGRGGMGCVFLAHDRTLDRDVALKVQLRGRLARGDDGDLAREAKLAALLTHEAIASVYDFGVHAERSFTIFEYVGGRDLREIMLDQETWSVESVIALLTPLAEALDFAHAEGVVHSDLKPENIRLTSGGTPKILDFGIAKNLKSDPDNVTFRGTAGYASPEQAGCRSADGRSDQYALGLIAYELLAGRRPFTEDDPLAQLFSHEYEKPPELADLRNDIPDAVAKAVMRTLEKDPVKRFATCREFVKAFDAPGDSFDRRSFPIRTEIHIAETSTESLVARRLARELESHGYQTWYYQRDALPGIPLSRQAEDSLQATRAALLLISRTSLASTEFAGEVMAASRLGRACLPILVDMSLEEFDSHQPIWRPALGTAGIIELDRDDIKKTAERVISAVVKLGIEPGRPTSERESLTRSKSAQTWATDANQIDIRELDDIVFRNDVIDEFLTKKNKYFISATKGLGKTLLLTYKRHLLTERGNADDSVRFVPAGRPYLDFMSEMKLLSAKYEKPLADLSTCKRLWAVALRVSILSHHGSLLEEDQQFELEPFPPRIQRWLKGSNVTPTVAFKELTSLRIGDANRLIDGTENFLDQQIRQVHGSTLVFVDKVDQAVRRLSRDAWINIQAGLIEAAWDLMSANSHIKVYASIRQEAFANYQSDVKSNLLGATTAIRYSDEELRGLLDRLAGCYEGAAGFKTFVGVNVIKHPRRTFPEDSFAYLRRYTFGRPRDFVAISSELSASIRSLDENRYCDVVRKTSSLGLVPNVFDETKVFLDCLHDKASRLRFMAQLNANILTRKEAVAASARFNGLPEDNLGHFDEESPEIFHPCRDLYLTGLLGFVRRNDQDVETQRFRQPDDLLNDSLHDLPNSSHYFLHPALSEYIREHRTSGDFRVIQHVLVGENAPWHEFDATICQVERELALIDDMNLRNDVHDLLALAKTILISAKSKILATEFDSSSAWYRTREKLLSGGYDEVILWIEELIS